MQQKSWHKIKETALNRTLQAKSVSLGKCLEIVPLFPRTLVQSIEWMFIDRTQVSYSLSLHIFILRHKERPQDWYETKAKSMKRKKGEVIQAGRSVSFVSLMCEDEGGGGRESTAKTVNVLCSQKTGMKGSEENHEKVCECDIQRILYTLILMVLMFLFFTNWILLKTRGGNLFSHVIKTRTLPLDKDPYSASTKIILCLHSLLISFFSVLLCFLYFFFPSDLSLDANRILVSQSSLLSPTSPSLWGT